MIERAKLTHRRVVWLERGVAYMWTYNSLGRFLSLMILVVIVAFVLTQYVGISQSAPGSISTSQFNASVVDRGREAFGQACVQCHGLNRTTIQRKTSAGWKKTVYSMISRGAPVFPDEIEPITSYLVATYGPDSPSPVAEGLQQSTALPDQPGREILVRSCVQCHGMETILESKKSEEEWEQTVDRMVSYGANVSPEEQSLVVKYAVTHLGP